MVGMNFFRVFAILAAVSFFNPVRANKTSEIYSGESSLPSKRMDFKGARMMRPPMPTAQKGLLRAQGTISYGRMFSLAANNIYLHGNLEYFPDNALSVKSDVYFFLNSFNSDQPFAFHHSLFSGVMFHSRTENNFVPYIGIQPGINYAKASSICMGQPCIQITPPEEIKASFSPLVSVDAGFNYFSGKFFHLFAEARYIAGAFTDNYNRAKLGEFRLSFGLGFHFNSR